MGGEDKEKSRKRCATLEETERVNSVLSGLGDVLEQVKEVRIKQICRAQERERETWGRERDREKERLRERAREREREKEERGSERIERENAVCASVSRMSFL